jgi:hypothetical protein
LIYRGVGAGVDNDGRLYTPNHVLNRPLARQVAFVPANQDHITVGVVQAGKFSPYLPGLAGNQDSHGFTTSVEEPGRPMRMVFCTLRPYPSKEEGLFSNFCPVTQ